MLVVPAHGQAVNAAVPSSSGVDGRWVDGGRAFTVTAPGLKAFRAGFAATVEADGVRQPLSSASGTPAGISSYTGEKTPYGLASGTIATVRFEKERLELLLRLERVAGAPGVLLVQAGLRNVGSRPVNLHELSPIAMDEALPSGPAAAPARLMLVSGKPETWLVTGLHAMTPQLLSFAEINGPIQLHEQGSFYRGDGTGFLCGPVGAPVAYISTRVLPLGAGRLGLCLGNEMNGVRVAPGLTRWGQQAALFFEPPRTALVHWTEWVGLTHGTRTAKGALSGWSSVYSPERIARGSDVLGVLDQIKKSEGRLQPDVVQIGESFEERLESNRDDMGTLFPEGFPFYARKIAAAGRRPGMKFDFIATPSTLNDYPAQLQGAVRDGFTFLKIGYHQLQPFMDGLAGGEKTSLETFRESFQAFRRAAGEDAYILHCDWFTNRAVLGLVDASRTGPVTTRNGVRDVMRHVLRSYPLNGRWFAVDNDTYYMATELKDVSPVVGGWPLARTWISMVGMSCGAAFTSDMWQQERFKPYWRNVEIMTPPAKERTEVLDLCTDREWPRLVGQVRREWGAWTVALLWNPAEKEQAVALDFVQAGLDPKRRYAVWSFWDDRYLGVAERGWTTPFLAPSASQHLCFTELPSGSNKPVLIGSNLHIYCGAAEIKRVTALESAMQIELTDAGARAGDLFIYSRFLPVLKDAVGCVVGGIAPAGENVWRLSLRNRRHGELQRVELGIPVPVVRQGWFWMLCALLAASLLFGVWRYLVGVRIQREHALEQERIRIARDIHDEVGASLTKIGQLAAGLPDPAIAETTRGVVQAMDEIVWAVNPYNDTLENMGNYLVHYTEEFLRPTGIACELDVPLTLPERSLTAELRHNVFMVVKEALNNAVKHGAPRRVRLGMSVDGGRLTVSVQDDGRGFVPPAAAAAGADGLANMRQRLAVVGGEFSLQSAPGQGTTVTVRVRLG